MIKPNHKSTKFLFSASAITALLASIFSGPASYASAQCVVDNFNDVTGSDSDGSRSIAYCMANVSAGGTITFDSDGPVTISLSNELTRTGDVIIDGAGLVTLKIDDGVDARIAGVSGDITVYGLTFEGGKESSNEGGAISATGSVTVSNSVFRNNVANLGGAIYAGTDVQVTDSVFKDNNAIQKGGGIYSFDGLVSVESSIFESNESQFGGGVYLESNSGSSEDKVTITNSKFTANAAQQDGGAAWSRFDIEATDSRFVQNTSQVDGGALYSLDDVDIENSEFEGNTAGGDGGAVFADDDVRAKDSVFEENIADHYGGALHTRDNNGDVRVSGSTFTKNSAGNDGGAVYAEDDFVAIDSTFMENTAGDDGGAAYSDRDDTNVTNSIFSKNYAGGNGGALFAHSDVRATSSSFIENESGNDGGALYANIADLDIKQSYFGLNSAGNDGGVASIDGHIKVENSTFYQNTAVNQGGVFANQNSSNSDDGHILYSTFVGNTAAEASVLLWDNAEMQLFGNVFLNQSTPALIAAEGSGSTLVDLGANATSGSGALFDHPSSRTGVSASSVDINEPGEPTLDSTPEIRFGSPESFGTSIDIDLAQAAGALVNLPFTDQGGNPRSFYKAPLSTDEIIRFIIPSFSGFKGSEIDLAISKAGKLDRLLSVGKAFYDPYDWGEIKVSTDDWASSQTLDVSSSDQCQLELNSTDVSLERYFAYEQTASLPVNHVVISCNIEPVTLGGGQVEFTVVREFKGSFFSTQVFASQVSGDPAPFNISIGGGLDTTSDTIVDSGTSSNWQYVVIDPVPYDQFNDAIVGFRSTSDFSFDSNPGTAFVSPGGTTYLTLNSKVTASSSSSEIFEAQVWTVTYDAGYSATAQSFASAVADAEFGCPFASVDSGSPTESCQTADSTNAVPNFLRADVGSFEFFPGATLVRGERASFASAPDPYSGPVVTDAQLVENQLMLEGTNLHLISSIILGDTELEIAGETSKYVDVSNLPEGVYSLAYKHQAGSVESSIDVQIAKPDPQPEFWTKQISPTEIKLYAKNIVGNGKIQFFHNGNEVAWVRAEDDTDPKLRVIDSGPMAGSNYLVRTRELASGKNVFEIYVDGERVLRRAQGN